MYNIITTKQFDKDFSLAVKRSYNIEALKQVISELEINGKPAQKYKPHKLKGNYSGHWECHIKPDWLLLWFKKDDKLEITLVRTGTHSDLF